MTILGAWAGRVWGVLALIGWAACIWEPSVWATQVTGAGAWVTWAVVAWGSEAASVLEAEADSALGAWEVLEALIWAETA